MFDFSANPQKPNQTRFARCCVQTNNPTAACNTCLREPLKPPNCQTARVTLTPRRGPTDELMHERAKNKMLQEEMEATLHDIQNM